MIQNVVDLHSRNQTGDKMYLLINRYAGDINKIAIKKNGIKKDLNKMSLTEFFNIVRDIPYRKDTAPIEIVARPKYILKLHKLGMDCKKKAILIASYCKLKNIPFRLIASSKKTNRRIHHVFPQIKKNGIWLNVDATYKHYKIFEPKRVTYAVQL